MGKPDATTCFTHAAWHDRIALQKADGFLSNDESRLFRNNDGLGGRKIRGLKHSTCSKGEAEENIASVTVFRIGVPDRMWSLEELVEQTSK